MRFVPASPPTTIPPEGDQPGALRPVRPTQRVETRMRVPLVFQRFTKKPQAEPKAENAPGERRDGPDRRKWCRRTSHNDYLLNTRSGEDRRKKMRRRGETAATLDEKV